MKYTDEMKHLLEDAPARQCNAHALFDLGKSGKSRGGLKICRACFQMFASVCALPKCVKKGNGSGAYTRISAIFFPHLRSLHFLPGGKPSATGITA